MAGGARGTRKSVITSTARGVLAWVVIAVAVGVLLLTIVPAEVWNHPGIDQAYSGFDMNLIYASNPNSTHISPQSIEFDAAAGVQPAVNIVTTSIARFDTDLRVTLGRVTSTGTTVRVGVWSPWTAGGFFIVFDGQAHQVIAESILNGSLGTVLIGGSAAATEVLGSYEDGLPYDTHFSIDKHNESLIASVDGVSVHSRMSLNPAQMRQLFTNQPISFGVSVSTQDGSSQISLERFTLTIPHARSWAVKVSDPREMALMTIGLGLGLGLLVAAALAWARALPSLSSWFHHSDLAPLRSGTPIYIGALAIAIYLVGNFSLFPLGGHPFDIGDEKLYAYVANAYGTSHLFYLPNFVSLAKIWGGVPYSENAFPYGPVMAYLFAAVGWINSALFARGAVFTVADVRLEYVIKAFNVAFGLADSLIILLSLKRTTKDRRWTYLGTALFMFNPAVWFSMSVWGQNHVFSLFFVLLTVLFIEKRWTLPAWLSLATACLTRPQMAVFGLLLGIVLIRRVSLRETISALSWTAVIIFVALTPLTLQTSPSLPIDVMLNNFKIQETSTNGVVLTTVSQDAYSVWLLVTYIARGASGLQRAFTPSSTILFDSVTYQRASQVVTSIALAIVSVALWRRTYGRLDPGHYLPLVALGITSFLFLFTGLVATHFLLALPFMILSYRWLGGIACIYIVAAWTVATFVPMFGDMGAVISARDYPALAPAHNAVTKFFVDLYGWDRFISVSVTANICAVIWLALRALQPPPHRHRLETA
jgi:hypothetical protein